MMRRGSSPAAPRLRQWMMVTLLLGFSVSSSAGGAADGSCAWADSKGSLPKCRETGDSLRGMVRRSLFETEKLPPSDPVAKYPPRLSGHWSSGYPRIDLAAKALQSFEGGLQLLLFRTDVSQLKEVLLSMPAEDWTDRYQALHNAYLSGRTANLDDVKPGVRSLMLVFSEHDGANPVRYPWYNRFAHLVEPLVKQVLGEGDMDKIIRMQLAYMAPGTQIKLHQDQGGYASWAHRIHIVVATNPQVVFAQCRGAQWMWQARQEGRREALEEDPEPEAIARTAAAANAAGAGCVPLHANEEGLVFELNNRLEHYVANVGDTVRIHLVVDVGHLPRTPTQLAVGQVCDYSTGRIKC